MSNFPTVDICFRQTRPSSVAGQDSLLLDDHQLLYVQPKIILLASGMRCSLSPPNSFSASYMCREAHSHENPRHTLTPESMSLSQRQCRLLRRGHQSDPLQSKRMCNKNRTRLPPLLPLPRADQSTLDLPTVSNFTLSSSPFLTLIFLNNLGLAMGKNFGIGGRQSTSDLQTVC